MRERIIDLKIEVIVNKLLYKKNIINQFERWLKLLSMYRIKKYQ